MKVLIIDERIEQNLKMVNEVIDKSAPLKFTLVPRLMEVKTGREKRRERRKLDRLKN